MKREVRRRGAIVYRSLRRKDNEALSDSGKRDRQGAPENPSLAPSLRPLIIGFVLLLILVVSLGLISVRAVKRVESSSTRLQSQQTGKVRLLLKLNTSVLRLDNEARIRAAAKARRELMPPFETRLRFARDELMELIPQIDHVPLEQHENWRLLQAQLLQFVETTRDLEIYTNDGFAQFREIQARVGQIEKELSNEQDAVVRQMDDLRNRTARELNTFWLLTLGIGVLVVAGTVWEVQRRYRRERRSREDARRERQFSTQMLEGTVSAVVAVDAFDQIRSANTPFFDIFPKAAVGGSVFDKFASPVVSRLLEAAISRKAAQPTYHGRWVLDGDAEVLGKAGSFDVYTSPLEIDEAQGQIVTLVDVTEAAQNEAVLRRTEALTAVGEATAQVAHEIRNPLGSIRLGVTMLRDMIDDPEAIGTIDLVERGIDHLNKLVVDVTQFSRHKPLVLKEVELHGLLDASLDLVADRIHEKETPVEKHYDDDALRGNWDEHQLRQAFVNLIANAIDASDKQSPVSIYTQRLTPQLAAGAKQGNGMKGTFETAKQAIARIIVEDHGAGIDPATRDRIFEPFFTTKKRGTGLGLAIVKQIIEQHGGDIRVDILNGQGTRFTVDLPLSAIKKTDTAGLNAG